MKEPVVNWREKEFLSVRDVSRILSIHYNTAHNLILTEIPYIKIGTTYRVSSKALVIWIKAQERRNAI